MNDVVLYVHYGSTSTSVCLSNVPEMIVSAQSEDHPFHSFAHEEGLMFLGSAVVWVIEHEAAQLAAEVAIMEELFANPPKDSVEGRLRAVENVLEGVLAAILELGPGADDSDPPTLMLATGRQATGVDVGVSEDGETFTQPEIVGAIAVVVNGKVHYIPTLKTQTDE